MSQPELFGSKPVARHSDPDTSHAAADSVTELTEKQETVLALLINYGPQLSDGEIAVTYRRVGYHVTWPQSESGLRTRRSELVRKGLVQDSGERVKLESGRMAILWEAVL